LTFWRTPKAFYKIKSWFYLSAFAQGLQPKGENVRKTGFIKPGKATLKKT
jgi:hypothetical protein